MGWSARKKRGEPEVQTAGDAGRNVSFFVYHDFYRWLLIVFSFDHALLLVAHKGKYLTVGENNHLNASVSTVLAPTTSSVPGSEIIPW